MIRWEMVRHQAVQTSLITMLTTVMFASANNIAYAEETIQKDVQKTSVNYSALTPRVYSADSDTGSSTVDDALSAQIHNERGVAYSGNGQYDLAIEEFNNALKIDPLSFGTYNNRGIAFAKEGQFGAAIADFTRALEINQNDASTYYNRGLTYAFVNRFDLALADFNKSLALNPVNAAVYDARARIYALLACVDWVYACKAGNCEPLKEAVRIGLCTESEKAKQ